MPHDLMHHVELSTRRASAYAALFGAGAAEVYPFHELDASPDAYSIDVFVYRLEIEDAADPVFAAVTNGMSDYLMTDSDTGETARRELIQYFSGFERRFAQRLYNTALLPLFDGFLLDEGDTVAWPQPFPQPEPFPKSFLARSIVGPHEEFSLDIEGEPMSFLWHIPITDEEWEYKKKHGSDALLDLMADAELPWIFDEANRPLLIKPKRRT